MRFAETQNGHLLGNFPVQHGGGDCMRCDATADRVLVFLLFPSTRMTKPATEMVFLWLCFSCAAAGQKYVETYLKSLKLGKGVARV